MDQEKYRKIFIQETGKYLDQIGQLLIQVDNHPCDTGLWSDLHGKMHSIKGMARAMSKTNIANLSHAMENWCLAFQNNAATAVPSAIQTMFDGVGILKSLVHQKNEFDSGEFQEQYRRIMERLSQYPPTNAAQVLQTTAETEPDAVRVDPIDQVRIPYAQIEELLGYSREILMLETTLPPIPVEFASVKGWVDHYMSMIKGLYFRLAQLRLMSIEDFAAIYSSTIHQQARSLGKRISLEVTGGNIRADIALLERLREPLIHIIRNSIAHGIEMPEERLRLGKPEKGRIVLEAESDKESLIIRVHDDGSGIDRDAIIRHLQNKCQMSSEEIANMTEKIFYDTILSTEFSSSKTVSEMSGRGIGMNVVAQAVEYLSGKLSIASVPQKGATFTIQLPVSLSVIYAVVFKVGPFLLAIPTSALESVAHQAEKTSVLPEFCLNLRKLFCVNQPLDEPMHILNLRSGSHRSKTPPKTSVQPEDISWSLAVDSIIGNRPIMIVHVSELIAKTRIYSGIGIMENGGISPLLDIPALFEILLKR
ncbi:MAG: Hpt domain-containing protein [Deltaproteobacteria bacterium]|nr:Hpt domain-containing protein [Deltaproteobacteria bacterium]